MALDVVNASNSDLIRTTNGCDGASYQDIQDAEEELKKRVGNGTCDYVLSPSGFQPPVDPAVSADARYIAEHAAISAKNASGRLVKHLWIIFVLLPVVLGVLFAILTAK